MANSLRQILQTYSEICRIIALCYSMMQHIDSEKQSMGSGRKMLAESLKSVFNEVLFIVNLHSFLLLLTLSRQTPPLGKSFVFHPSMQNNLQNSPLYTHQQQP